MDMQKNILALHSTVARHSPLAIDLDIARTVGFDAVEMYSGKLEAYLAAGFSEADLKTLLSDVQVTGIGYLRDIERQGAERDDMLQEAERLFQLANLAGAKGVQVLTGPINVQAVLDIQQRGRSDHYAGLVGRSQADQLALTAKKPGGPRGFGQPVRCVALPGGVVMDPAQSSASAVGAGRPRWPRQHQTGGRLLALLHRRGDAG
jgi:hypothetical protein